MRRFTLFLALMIFIGMQVAQAQTRTLSGKVTDANDGVGVPGVSVYLKGTTIGTTSDANGDYSFSIPVDANTVVFSFIGMRTVEVAIEGRSVINIAMEYDVTALEELVVSGVAGAVSRQKLSVTVDRVGSETLEALPATSAASALQGKISGITVVQASGNPGQGANIRLRGSTSLLGDSKPLIIMDGVMMEGDLADVNIDDIESMEVVKGAAASALYGSRAGAGVIAIRTKRGNIAKEGTTSVRIRNEYGFSQLPKKVELSKHHAYDLAEDWEDFKDFTKYEGVTYPEGYAGGYDEAIAGNKQVSHDAYADNPYAFTKDHQDMLFNNGTYYSNYIGVAHNAGKTSIFTSFENAVNTGIVWNSDGSSRQNFRFNADHWFGDKVSFSASTFVAQNKIDVADGRFTDGWGGGQGSAFFDMLFFEPDTDLEMDAPTGFLLPKYYIHPNHWQRDNGNPLHSLYYQDRNLERKLLMQSFQGNYYATDWLSFNAMYSQEKTNTLNENYRPKGFNTSQQVTEGGIFKYTQEQVSQIVSFTANTVNQFGELQTRGKVSYLYEDFNSYFFSVNASDLAISNVTSLNAISGDKTVESNTIDTRARNFFAIVDADYKDRYIVSALFRMDGSSLFGENERWNPYYRFSGAYRISQDLELPGIDELKIRTAYGTSGQRPGFNYQYETYSVSQGNISKTTIGNKDLKPSETKELEFGLNVDFLDMFDFEFTYADIVTEGAFLNVPLPAATGFQYQWQNAADISATAIEFTLGVMPIKKPDFQWRMAFNFDKISQEITRLDAPPFRVGPTINDLQVFYIKDGEPFGMMYGGDWVTSLDQLSAQLAEDDDIANYVVNSDGYVIKRGTEGTVNEAPIRLKDENGDDAFIRIADMNPDFNLSWLNSFTYKNINFNMLWQWKQGGDIYNQTKQWLFRDERHGDFDQSDKAPNEKKVTTYYQAFYRVNEPNSYFVEDGTYLKLREASLYYTVNKRNLTNMGINFVENVKLGIIGRNLLTFTKYSGWDPEVSQVDYAESNSTNYYIDMFNYPNYRTVTFSLEINF
jgi:TonB-linked SusC/RagA family outer membrane protein